MRIISRRRLREFWTACKGGGHQARRDLSVWYKLTEHADWEHFAALRRTFSSADAVGNCVVFNVGSNRYRLVGRVNFAKGIVYILKVMDHLEYDSIDWARKCGCHEPPPKADPKRKRGVT